MSSFIIQIMKMFTSYAQKVYFNHLKKNNGFIFVYLVICYIITNFALFVKFSFKKTFLLSPQSYALHKPSRSDFIRYLVRLYHIKYYIFFSLDICSHTPDRCGKYTVISEKRALELYRKEVRNYVRI